MNGQEEKLGEKLVKANVLLRETSAVPFDPNAGWKEGDLLPRYYLGAKGTIAQ